MSRLSGLASSVLLVCSLACARSALPDTSRDGTAAAGSAARAQPDAEPEIECTPCGERLSAQQSLRCLCRTLSCPRDLDRALTTLEPYAAFGTGCDHAWFVRRIGRGYDLLVFLRSSGALVYAQHTTGDMGFTCEDGTETLIVEGGRVPECDGEHMLWCRFAHAGSEIALGTLDSAMVCDERALSASRLGR